MPRANTSVSNPLRQSEQRQRMATESSGSASADARRESKQPAKSKTTLASPVAPLVTSLIVETEHAVDQTPPSGFAFNELCTLGVIHVFILHRVSPPLSHGSAAS